MEGRPNLRAHGAGKVVRRREEIRGVSQVPAKMSMSFEDLSVGGRGWAGRGHLPCLGEQAACRPPAEEGGVVSFLSYVEVHQGRRWGWRRRLRTRADKRPKAVSSTSWLGSRLSRAG